MGVTLSTGTHTLTFYGREVDARLDRVFITTGAETLPDQPQPPTPTAVPAGTGNCKVWIRCNGKYKPVTYNCNLPKPGAEPCPWQ
jgi:hypothetical protein